MSTRTPAVRLTGKLHRYAWSDQTERPSLWIEAPMGVKIPGTPGYWRCVDYAGDLTEATQKAEKHYHKRGPELRLAIRDFLQEAEGSNYLDTGDASHLLHDALAFLRDHAGAADNEAVMLRYRRALNEIALDAPDEAPEVEDWGGDTEEAENYGMAAGYYEAAVIARRALQPATTAEYELDEQEHQREEDSRFLVWLCHYRPETFSDLVAEWEEATGRTRKE